MKDTQNPIALRSRQWLTNALLELMKDKVICFHLETIWLKGMQQLSADSDHSYFHTIRWYLELWYEQKELALLLYRNDLISLLLLEYNHLFKEVYLMRKGNYPLAKQSDAMSYALSFSVGGLLNILWQWASDGMEKSPDEVANLLLTAIRLPDSE